MWRVPSDLLQVAERIAQAENRIGKLRLRVERLKDEGSDATQAEELLNIVAATLPPVCASIRFAPVISK